MENNDANAIVKYPIYDVVGIHQARQRQANVDWLRKFQSFLYQSGRERADCTFGRILLMKRSEFVIELFE